MKRSTTLATTFLALAALAGGCGGGEAPDAADAAKPAAEKAGPAGAKPPAEAAAVTPKPPPALSAEQVRQAADMVGTVFGRGKFETPAGEEVSFEFDANLLTDGSGTGSFSQSYESAGGGVVFSGEITCVALDGKAGRAWVGGVIKQNNSADENFKSRVHVSGRPAWFLVRDIALGAREGQPGLSFLQFEGEGGYLTSEEFCAARKWPADDAGVMGLSDGTLAIFVRPEAPAQ